MTNHGETQWMPTPHPRTWEEKENKAAWELEHKGPALEGESFSSGILLCFWGKASDLLF